MEESTKPIYTRLSLASAAFKKWSSPSSTSADLVSYSETLRRISISSATKITDKRIHRLQLAYRESKSMTMYVVLCTSAGESGHRSPMRRRPMSGPFMDTGEFACPHCPGRSSHRSHGHGHHHHRGPPPPGARHGPPMGHCPPGMGHCPPGMGSPQPMRRHLCRPPPHMEFGPGGHHEANGHSHCHHHHHHRHHRMHDSQPHDHSHHHHPHHHDHPSPVRSPGLFGRSMGMRGGGRRERCAGHHHGPPRGRHAHHGPAPMSHPPHPHHRPRFSHRHPVRMEHSYHGVAHSDPGAQHTSNEDDVISLSD